VDERSERYAEALRTAIRVLGSRMRLAGFLGVREEQLARWLEGAESAPQWAFVQTLDLIADDAYSAQPPSSVA
jgi:hypothetical protein